MKGKQKEKAGSDEEVTLTVLGKICKALDRDYGDIVVYVPDKERSDNS